MTVRRTRRGSSSPGASVRTTKPKKCVDCIAEGILTRRDAKYPGPRCHTHHLAFNKKTSDTRKAAHVQKTYNITEDEYQALLKAQGGGCALCGRKPGRKRLAVDHDHKCCAGKISCGKCVRGLLCKRCNTYLGYIRDAPSVGLLIHDYLINPPAQPVLIAFRGTQ